MTYDFSNNGFGGNFSALVAEAAMTLPPLVREDDGQFVLGVAGKALNAFWTEYVGSLPHEIQTELLLAIEKKDEDAILEWYVNYANFTEDEAARGLATVILDELRDALPTLIREEYDSYHHSSLVA